MILRSSQSIHQVEEILGLDVTDRDWLDGATYRITAMADVEEAATSVRIGWNLGGDPIPDMTELLEERSIKVLKLSLPGTVDGLSFRVRRVRGDYVPIVVCTTYSLHHGDGLEPGITFTHREQVNSEPIGDSRSI